MVIKLAVNVNAGYSKAFAFCTTRIILYLDINTLCFPLPLSREILADQPIIIIMPIASSFFIRTYVLTTAYVASTYLLRINNYMLLLTLAMAK